MALKIDQHMFVISLLPRSRDLPGVCETFGERHDDALAVQVNRVKLRHIIFHGQVSWML